MESSVSAQGKPNSNQKQNLIRALAQGFDGRSIIAEKLRHSLNLVQYWSKPPSYESTSLRDVFLVYIKTVCPWAGRHVVFAYNVKAVRMAENGRVFGR